MIIAAYEEVADGIYRDTTSQCEGAVVIVVNGPNGYKYKYCDSSVIAKAWTDTECHNWLLSKLQTMQVLAANLGAILEKAKNTVLTAHLLSISITEASVTRIGWEYERKMGSDQVLKDKGGLSTGERLLDYLDQDGLNIRTKQDIIRWVEQDVQHKVSPRNEDLLAYVQSLLPYKDYSADFMSHIHLLPPSFNKAH